MAIEAQIRQLIEKDGEISIATLMEVAMSLKFESYYKSQQPLGEDGDFITSPEISQMFGEIVGMWCISVWSKINRPINLVELGPGRGLLMRDLLNGTANIPNFHKSLNIYLIDINPQLTKIQKDNLSQFDIPITWISGISELPNIPTIFIANEFFDALPIHQYVKEKNSWCENVVAIKSDNKSLYFKHKPLFANFHKQLHLDHKNAGDGAIVEESPESIKWMQDISEKISKDHGAALIIDYGYDIPQKTRKSTEYNPTLQGVKDHKYHPILNNLGFVDLSAHVDFHALRTVATSRNLNVQKTMNQSLFLKNFGIDIRLKTLQDKNPDMRQILHNQYHRLTSDKQMGKLFKVLIVKSFE